MKSDNHIEDLNDKLLFDLIGNLPLEKAPEGFNAGIMQQIYSGVEPFEYTPEYRRQMLWAYIAIGVTVLLAVFMLFAQWPFLKISFLSTPEQLRDLLNASLGIFDGFSKVLSFVKSSSSVFIIFIALTLLLIFERLFRKGISSDRSFTF
ncbi:MAG: hypothetical protein H6541_14255 [Lentimicrobiaceae bacterium]|nr:hypothetical protein [Lentimicrobiaceae bacterium]MCO5265069.1 hypothetical protein [Lentimicrobium sp.]